MTTSYTLTGDLRDVLGESASALEVYIAANLADGAALVDLDANEVRLAGYQRVPVTGTTFSVDLIGTGSTGTNLEDPDALRYTLRVLYVPVNGGRNPVRTTWSCSNFALTADSDLSDLVETADPPASIANQYLTQMQALLDDVEEISGLTGEDAAVALLVDDEGSDTRLALNGLYAGIDDALAFAIAFGGN